MADNWIYFRIVVGVACDIWRDVTTQGTAPQAADVSTPAAGACTSAQYRLHHQCINDVMDVPVVLIKLQ